MVPNVVPHYRPTSAGLGHHLVLNGDVIFGIVNIFQQDVEHQSGLGRDFCPCQTGSGGFQTFKYLYTSRYEEWHLSKVTHCWEFLDLDVTETCPPSVHRSLCHFLPDPFSP